MQTFPVLLFTPEDIQARPKNIALYISIMKNSVTQDGNFLCLLKNSFQLSATQGKA
jgi:hypothetical protein